MLHSTFILSKEDKEIVNARRSSYGSRFADNQSKTYVYRGPNNC